MNEGIAIDPDDDDDDDDAAARPRRAQTHPRAVGDIPAEAVLVSPHTHPLVLRNRPLALKLRPLAVSDVATGVATVVTARSMRRQHPRTILGVGILRKKRKRRRMERMEVGRTARRRREGIAGCGDVASGPREGRRPRRHRRRRLPPPCCPSRLKSGRHWHQRRDSRHCRLSTQGILSSLSAFAWSCPVILFTVTTTVFTSKPTLTRALSSFLPVCPWPCLTE